MDILLTEAEYPQAGNQINGDQLLADAIAQSNKVVLPLVSQNGGKGLVAARHSPAGKCGTADQPHPYRTRQRWRGTQCLSA
jgi:hypothetical protein